MPYFKKKPVVIEAVQLCWRNWDQVCEFLGDIINEDNPGRHGEASDTCGEEDPYINLTIPTIEGDHTALHGDWIIKGVQGEYYPCKPDIFAETYEEVQVVREEEDYAVVGYKGEVFGSVGPTLCAPASGTPINVQIMLEGIRLEWPEYCDVDDDALYKEVCIALRLLRVSRAAMEDMQQLPGDD